MAPNLLIFDFDGVIVNTEDVFFNHLYEVLQSYNINLSRKECYKIFSGNDTYTTLKQVVNQYNPSLDVDEIFSYLTVNHNVWLNNTTRNPYIKELLEVIRIPYCIASNSGRDHILKTLKHIKLDHFFDNNIFSADTLGRYKPDPAVYLEALKQMGVSADRTIAIEDSIPGVTAARAASIPTIGFVGSENLNFEEHSNILKGCGAFTTVSSFHDVLPYITQ